ncbi:UDP-N-acetylmuramate dehydrogenase [Emcibacter nanhaiensis]|uniref:UDP-N-acetylenolpyruvoylglucosamine reductase n=1 Tax=Emcibacter nanhaiensis TaxID=1505037 RepID=A0A501PCJ1_9PROT|nr:UDP-N-acetylmuramate dehydrogenase [Emcibacter nanhaiensis]TPD57624.1 UDP-N-acetylmuramate dehydrogenase [Emcibacter nanhaiensis]
MTVSAATSLTLADRLPQVRGKYEFDAPLAKLTWFKVGGPAAVLFTPEDEEDLATFLRRLPREVPLLCLGVGSNLLIRDGGFDGVVIRFGKKFSDITVKDTEVMAGAGAPDIAVAAAARDASLAGLEFLRGIPGTIGGAVRMNAGAYEREMADVLVESRALDRAGNAHRFTLQEMGYSYRHSDLAEDLIFTGAILQGTPDLKENIERRMQQIADAREESQPLRTRTGGSTFKNPAGHKAWQLIDAAGCRGLRVGGAHVSEKHCNFLINDDNGTAADLENLGEDVRRRVKETSGVGLEWEIRIVGDAKEDRS